MNPHLARRQLFRRIHIEHTRVSCETCRGNGRQLPFPADSQNTAGVSAYSIIPSEVPQFFELANLYTTQAPRFFK